MINPDGTVTISGVCMLGSVVIPDSIDGRMVTGIRNYAFAGCTGLTSITIPDSVARIGGWAFSGCERLTNVTIGNGVTGIEGGAFSGCTGLTQVLIPDNVTHIAEGAFSGCIGLTSIAVDPKNPAYTSEEGVLFSTDQTTLVCYPGGKAGGYTIPNRVTRIGYNAFFGCGGLTNVTIPDSVTSLGEGAFSGCAGLIDLTIGGGVTRIGDRAFNDCAGLTNVTIFASVTSIGVAAFAGCTSLTSITIPDSVTSIGDQAFAGCPLGGDPLFNTSRTMLTWFPRGKSGGYTIPGSVTNIGGGAFGDCTGLTDVTIPDSVTSIGDGAFASCSRLTNITIGKGVTRIGRSAFMHCTGLTSIVIPGSVREWAEERPSMGIAFGSFLGCTSLGMVTIQKGVSGIPGFAFCRCTSLANITIPDSVTSIGYAAFFGCTGLNSVAIPDGVTRIGDRAFAGCASLEAAYFAGDAPPADETGVFSDWEGGLSPTSVYYLAGTQGWTSTFSGRPTAPWLRPSPTILDLGDRFGPSPNGFGFVISWATNVPVVVEASADIGTGWTPISTNTLTDGWVQFTDADWESQPARFYRVRGQ